MVHHRMRWALAVAGSTVAIIALAGVVDTDPQDPTTAITVVPPAADTPAPVAAAPAATPNALTTYDWSQVDEAVQNGAVRNLTFTVGNAERPLYTTTKGTATGTNPTDLASASKWLIGAVAMRMVEAGKVSLDDHPQKYLSWWTNDPADPRSQVTLRQLLSLQAGFNSNPVYGGCVEVPLLFTLSSCAQTIYSTRIDYSAVPDYQSKGLPFSYSDPGTLFSYGPHHLQIAAAMLEAAGGVPYTQLFRDYVATPLTMTQTRYVFVPEPTGIVTAGPNSGDPPNPWVAGGGESTVADYSKFLRAFLGTGFIHDMDAFTQPRTIGVKHGYVPPAAANWEYALGSFVECSGAYTVGATSRSDCGTRINSSPGAYGWLGWIDRSTGYYALIATHTPTESDPASVVLEHRLQCEITFALRFPNPTGPIPKSGCAPAATTPPLPS